MPSSRRRYTPHTIQTEAELHAALRRVRADGWAVCDGHIYEESRGIAVPIYGAHNDVIAAIGVVVPDDDAPTLPHVELLAHAAREIGAAMRAAYLPTGHPAATPGGRFRPLVNSSVRSMEYLEAIGS